MTSLLIGLAPSSSRFVVTVMGLIVFTTTPQPAAEPNPMTNFPIDTVLRQLTTTDAAVATASTAASADNGTLATPAVPPLILVADDDGEHRLLLSRLLRKSGFRASLAQDGASLMKLFTANPPDLVLLDLMLPDEDGLALCRRIRAMADTPIIMLTALGRGPYKVAGLEMGADDYIAKPFDPDELVARIRAVLRRSRNQSGRVVTAQARRRYHFDNWSVDVAKRQVMSPDDVVITLTSGEFDLLMAFVEHPQTVLTREHLVELSRGRHSDGFDRSVDILVSRLRRKMEANAKEPRMIKTVRSGGYLFAPTVHLVGGG